MCMWRSSSRTATAIIANESTATPIQAAPWSAWDCGMACACAMGVCYVETMKKVERKLDIFPHIFPREYFERMKRIAEGNPGLAAALKRWMHIPVLWNLDQRILSLIHI